MPFGFVTSMGANGELKNLSPLPTPNVQYPRKPHKFFAGQYERWELEMAAKKGLSLGR